jgi:hypothetical protein
MIVFLKNIFSKKEIPKYIEFSKAKKYLKQNQVVWCWCEYPAGKEWRECIYDKGDLCIKLVDTWNISTVPFIDYSLSSYRRLPQNVIYFTIEKKKPKKKFK